MLAVLLYQCGIANVFAVRNMLNPADGAQRLLQSTFRECEMFAHGLAAAGCIVRTFYANVAGDAVLQPSKWTESNEDAPFKSAMRPVSARHSKQWPIAETGEIALHTGELDGKTISYSSATEFLVQVGRGNGSYKTRNTVTGNLLQAVMLYRCINVGNGYKKRLLMPSCSKHPVLARQFS